MALSERNQSFATLFESILTEASQVLDLFPENSPFQKLVKLLHKRRMLSHQSVPDITISKNQVKEMLNMILVKRITGLFILVGDNNTVAIQSTSSRDILLRANNENLSSRDIGFSYSGRDMVAVNINIINSLELGNIKTILYFKSPKTYITKTRRIRRSRREGAGKMTENRAVSLLLKKFKPILMKNLVKARADLQGYLVIRTKNNPENLTSKLRILKELVNDIESIELGISNFEESTLIRAALHNAVIMSAAYLYPDQVENIYRRYDEIRITGKAVDSLLKDLSEGKNQIIATVLGFFRKELVRVDI